MAYINYRWTRDLSRREASQILGHGGYNVKAVSRERRSRRSPTEVVRVRKYHRPYAKRRQALLRELPMVIDRIEATSNLRRRLLLLERRGLVQRTEQREFGHKCELIFRDLWQITEAGERELKGRTR